MKTRQELIDAMINWVSHFNEFEIDIAYHYFCTAFAVTSLQDIPVFNTNEQNKKQAIIDFINEIEQYTSTYYNIITSYFNSICACLTTIIAYSKKLKENKK